MIKNVRNMISLATLDLKDLEAVADSEEPISVVALVDSKIFSIPSLVEVAAEIRMLRDKGLIFNTRCVLILKMLSLVKKQLLKYLRKRHVIHVRGQVRNQELLLKHVHIVVVVVNLMWNKTLHSVEL